MVVITIYTANLTANLSHKEFSTPIKSIHELVAQKNVKFGIHAALLKATKNVHTYGGDVVNRFERY